MSGPSELNSRVPSLTELWELWKTKPHDFENFFDSSIDVDEQDTLSYALLKCFFTDFDKLNPKTSSYLVYLISNFEPEILEIYSLELRKKSLEFRRTGKSNAAARELKQFGCWLGEIFTRSILIINNAQTAPIQAALTVLATWMAEVETAKRQKGNKAKKVGDILVACFVTGLAKGLIKGIQLLATKGVHVGKNVTSLIVTVAGRPIHATFSFFKDRVRNYRSQPSKDS